MKSFYLKNESFDDVAQEFGVSIHAIRCDWERRGSWMPQLLLLNDVQALQADIIGKWIAYLDLCMSNAQLYKLDNKRASNESLKNYAQGLDHLANLLQSMGALPKIALEQTVTVKKTTTTDDTSNYIWENATEEEKQIIMRGLSVETQIHNRKNNTEKLH
jgi:virulence-associated protein VapD